ncbi:MAG TPA: PD-(D/E)XK nuclease family protein [Candidatus Limnocylindrales bacterium]|nr:PD-(D/E)XK nuclease family protein [Candidatus Limnocylindrales bacterium]
MPDAAHDAELLRLVDSDPPAWIVTPTRRLARALTLRVAELRAAAGREVGDAASIDSVDDWMRRLGLQLLAHRAASGRPARVLLSPQAERLAWEKIIFRMPGDLPRELLDVSALAGTAATAWERCCLWGEPSWSDPMTQDAEAFRDWLPAFRAWLDERDFVTAAELPALIADAIEHDDLGAPLPAILVAPAFEKHEPALARIVAALGARGIQIRDRITQPARAAAAAQVWRAATPASELRTVAARIRERLIADPNLRVAVLTPDPSAYGARLERIFEEELDAPGMLTIGAVSRRRFDYAEAPKLADYPLVAGALELLALPSHGVDFGAASRILLGEFPRTVSAAGAGAPIDNGADDRIRRGTIEARLRRERAAALRLAFSETSLATALRKGGLERRARALETISRRLEADNGKRRSPSGWRSEWIDRLEMCDWPGPLRGDVEGLVFRRWRDAMDAFAMLEFVEQSMDASEALRRLREICEQTPVQPASEHHSVQVMNLLDAAGLDFDVVYAIGMTASVFPAAPRPNPLLPVRWQRVQPGMPRVSVEAERELADRVWQRVLRSAGEVHASYASAGDSGEDNVASACIAGLEPMDAGRSEGVAWWAAASAALEPRPAEKPVAPLVRSGGASILRHQSDCPFRAFAAVRLGAEPLDAIGPQPNASQRGTLVHAALAAAYRLIPTSDDLKGLGNGNIDELARDVARETVDGAGDVFDDAPDLAASARMWLAELVASWMRHERDDRRGPWAVESLEADFTGTFPPDAETPLTFHYRPDRIDRVEDGALVIIDFKTSGSAKTPSAWNGDRPAEPQLPLYLALRMAAGYSVDGIAFGNLSARDACVLAGAGAREFSDKFAPPTRKKLRTRADYDTAVSAYLAATSELAHAYLRGDAGVDPRKSAVCTLCRGHALCRVGESGAADDQNGEEENGE